MALAARAHHTLPAHADAVGVLVGAARPVVHQQLHVGHVSRLPGLAVQVAPLVCCGGMEGGEGGEGAREQSPNVRETHQKLTQAATFNFASVDLFDVKLAELIRPLWTSASGLMGLRGEQ